MLIKFIIAVLMVSSVYARDVIEQSDYCSINWSKGIISCQGESAEGQKKFRAKRSAVVVAQRNLLELIKGVRIDSETTVEEGMLKSDIIKSSVSGMIKGARIVSNKYNRQYKSSVATLKIYMGKDLREALMSDKNYASWNDKMKSFFLNIVSPTTLNASETYNIEDENTLEKLAKDFKEKNDLGSLSFVEKLLKNLKTKSFTGLLIDARSVSDLEVAMNIKLVDENGKEIYPAKFVSEKQFVGKNGVSVGLDFDIDDAKKNKRVFSIPLEIKGLSTYKKRKSDIVISNSDVKKINIIANALRHAKVIVVVGD